MLCAVMYCNVIIGNVTVMLCNVHLMQFCNARMYVCMYINMLCSLPLLLSRLARGIDGFSWISCQIAISGRIEQVAHSPLALAAKLGKRGPMLCSLHPMFLV